jgi:carbon-monoxide dehydrogenase large subunit
MVPSFELDLTETPSPNNPLGAKGVGESGCVGSPPAIVNAVLDALAPLGITQLDMPLTSDRIWRAMNEAEQRQPIRREEST